jgi:hypothetical protein
MLNFFQHPTYWSRTVQTVCPVGFRNKFGTTIENQKRCSECSEQRFWFIPRSRSAPAEWQLPQASGLRSSSRSESARGRVIVDTPLVEV